MSRFEDQSAKLLEASRRTAIETEEIATATLSEMRKQRDQINRTHERVDQVEENLRQSNQTLNSMNSNYCCIS